MCHKYAFSQAELEAPVPVHSVQSAECRDVAPYIVGTWVQRRLRVRVHCPGPTRRGLIPLVTEGSGYGQSTVASRDPSGVT
eukprot:1287758-Rhodomonas_salina.2